MTVEGFETFRDDVTLNRGNMRKSKEELITHAIESMTAKICWIGTLEEAKQKWREMDVAQFSCQYAKTARFYDLDLPSFNKAFFAVFGLRPRDLHSDYSQRVTQTYY